jgi:glycosyltransferase involved in cell wall biosynthesis
LLSPGCNFPEVTQARAGRIAPVAPAILAESLAQMLSKPEELKEMGLRGLELVKNKYSWHHITDQILEVYSEGIERHRLKNEEPRLDPQ